MADLSQTDLGGPMLASTRMASSQIDGYPPVAVSVHDMVKVTLVDDANPDKYQYHTEQIVKFGNTVDKIQADMIQLKAKVNK
ncbi:hypothetical protein SS50377_21752 [Spironucleus salmonicida]|uniref:Uncharacterized protein n=1 Tax=Spironucleus salmonicida TaxID=348837 RepID=V6LNU7_9EUKA|nr:hypothetical protein SS50377_21752 [Spironucleus salmonicida]|eukprot:EST45391.1 Hypothetical protein SS50377_14666 [Spironucleus salmonicida]